MSARGVRCCSTSEDERARAFWARGTILILICIHRVRYLVLGNPSLDVFRNSSSRVHPAQTPSAGVIAQSPLEFSQHDSIDRTEGAA